MFIIKITCHGFGFSTFKSTHSEITLELTHTLDQEQPVRLSRLILKKAGKKHAVYACIIMLNGFWVMSVQNMHLSYSPRMIPYVVHILSKIPITSKNRNK